MKTLVSIIALLSAAAANPVLPPGSLNSGQQDNNVALAQNGAMGLINIQVQKVNNVNEKNTNNHAQANIDLGSKVVTPVVPAPVAPVVPIASGGFNQGSGFDNFQQGGGFMHGGHGMGQGAFIPGGFAGGMQGGNMFPNGQMGGFPQAGFTGFPAGQNGLSNGGFPMRPGGMIGGLLSHHHGHHHHHHHRPRPSLLQHLGII